MLYLVALLSLALCSYTCVNNETFCDCKAASSRLCLQLVSNNTCLLGECDFGYYCDCDGYETCAKVMCDDYIGALTATLSDTTPFPCLKRGKKRECLHPTGILETPRAAILAEQDVGNMYWEMAEVTDEVARVTRELREIQSAVDGIVRNAISAHWDKRVYRSVYTVDTALESAEYALYLCTSDLRRARDIVVGAQGCRQKVEDAEWEERTWVVNRIRERGLERKLKEIEEKRNDSSRDCVQRALDVRREWKRVRARLNDVREWGREGRKRGKEVLLIRN